MQLDPLGAVAVVGAAVGLMPGGVVLGLDPLTRGPFAGPVFVVISGPETVPETSGDGCNLFCGEVHRLPLGLCRSPGGAAAIVWRWVRVGWIVAGARVVLLPAAVVAAAGLAPAMRYASALRVIRIHNRSSGTA